VKEERARVRFPRRIKPGSRPRVEPGTPLNCLVLSAGDDEWIGVDLASGALLRSRRDQAPLFQLARTDASERRVTRFDVIAVEPDEDDETLDPARPEAIAVRQTPRYLGRPSPRRVRRLLEQLAAPEQRGAALLSSWGPSVAYVDLDGSTQSVAVVGTSPRQLSLERRGEDVAAIITWSGKTQAVPIDDAVARRAVADEARSVTKSELVEALGFRPSYLVCALGKVRDGHAKKAIFAVLPRQIPRRFGRRLRRLLWEGAGG
jgi:hypothetical protein